MYCFVLHIGINIYFTNNKETHRSCACFQRANTRSGRMFGRVCMLKASTLVFFLLFVQHLYIIFQYVTQNSTFTRQNTLSLVILVLIIMFTLVSGVHVCNKVI